MKTILDSPEFADIREHQNDWKWLQCELSKTAKQLESIRRRRAALLLCAYNLGKVSEGDTLNGIPIGDYLAYARDQLSYKALDRLKTATDCVALAKTGLPPSAQDLYLEKSHHHYKVTDDGKVVETRATLDKIPRADFGRTYHAAGLMPKAERLKRAEAEAKAIRQCQREHVEFEAAKNKPQPPWRLDEAKGALVVLRACEIPLDVLAKLVKPKAVRG